MTGKEGFFLARRQLQKALFNRITDLEIEQSKIDKTVYSIEAHKIINARIQELESIHDFVRNNMLWDKTNDKKE